MAEPLNATFFAFRKRERGGVLLQATLAYAVLAILLGAVFLFLAGQAVVDYMNWVLTMGASAKDADPDDPSAVLSAMMPPASVMSLGPMSFLFSLVGYLLIASFEAACLRWMIRGETKGLFGLALDADTWRVYFTYWIWLFLLFGLYIVMAILFAGIGVAIAVGAQGAANSDSSALMLVPLLMVLAFLFALIYFGVRFAPASATSVAKRRFAFFDAWTVTKGRFWPLLGSFALLFVAYLVCVTVMGVAIWLFAGAGIVAQMQAADEPAAMQDLLALFASPAVWIPIAVGYGVILVCALVFRVALFGVNARAAQAALEEGKIQAAG